MKKMIKVFGILAVVVCLSLSFAACGDNGKKGDDGIAVVAVSEQKFADTEKAVKAYVADELKFSHKSVISTPDGETDIEIDIVLAEYVGHESKGDVAIEKVKLADGDKTGLASIEKIAVKAKIALKPESGEDAKYEEITQTVYALKYGETEYKYLVATPENGERITNSYLKSVADYKKYTNSTITGILKNKEETDEELVFGSGVEYKFASNGMYGVQYENEERFNNRTPGGEAEDYDSVSYALKVGSNMVSVRKTYNNDESKFEWAANKMPDRYDSLDKITEGTVSGDIFGIFKYNPAALYKKTANGFEMKTVVTTDGETETIELNATVSDGKIVKVLYTASLEWEDEGVKYSEKMFQDVSFGSFGTTTVNVPAEVTDAANKLGE